MTINNKYLLTFYYCFLIMAIVVKAASTVYAGSVVVNHGNKLAELDQQKQALEHKKAILTQEIALNKSLNRLTEVATTKGYFPISNPSVIKGAESVASAL
jgi:cell division protein FtsL